MYPKTTFDKKTKENAQNTDKRNLKSVDYARSHLSFSDDSDAIYTLIDIDMPYVILYEKISMKSNTTVYQEYSEFQKILVQNPYSDFMNFSHKLHVHNFYELTYVLSGELTLTIENEDVIYKAGDCCLCNKNIHHMEQPNSEVEFILFLIKEEYLTELLRSNYFYDNNHHPVQIDSIFDVFFAENKKNPIYDAKIYNDYRLMSGMDSGFLIEIINDMITELSGDKSGKSYMMKALFCRLFELLQNNEMYREEIHWAQLSNIENIVFQIAKAYKNKEGIFTRQEIETITGYQSDYVERVFKKITGMTLLGFGKEIVVTKAADMLVDTELSITEICERLGYSNRNYFNKIFSTKYGMTPSEYRKSARISIC